MKRTFRIQQEWLIEVEPDDDETHMMAVIQKMLEIPIPVIILKGWRIPAKQLDTATDFEEIQTCRVCGCTDANCRQCIEKTGSPCHWVAPDLCSACA